LTTGPASDSATRPPRFAHSPTVLSRTTGETVILLTEHVDEPFELDAPAAAVWDTFATPRTLDDALGALGASFDAEPDRLEADVARVVGDLCARGALHAVG